MEQNLCKYSEGIRIFETLSFKFWIINLGDLTEFDEKAILSNLQNRFSKDEIFVGFTLFSIFSPILYEISQYLHRPMLQNLLLLLIHTTKLKIFTELMKLTATKKKQSVNYLRMFSP